LSSWDFVVFEVKFLHLLGVFMRFAGRWLAQVFSISNRHHAAFDLAKLVVFLTLSDVQKLLSAFESSCSIFYALKQNAMQTNCSLKYAPF
jgi:hypothetical protein